MAMNLNLIPTPTLEAEQFSVPPFQGQQQPMPQPMPEQPQGLLGRIGAGIKRSVQDPNFMDRLTIGLGGMTMRPNEALMGLAQNRIEQRQKLGLINEQKNRTIEALKRLNTPQAMRALQLLDAGGSVSDAATMAFQKPNIEYKIVDGRLVKIDQDANNVDVVYEGKKKPDVKNVDGTLVDITDPNNPIVVYEGDKDSNIEYQNIDGKLVKIDKDTNNVEVVYEGGKGDRETKIQDFMNTFNISRQDAVSFLAKRYKSEVDTFGNVRIIDTLTGKEIPSETPKPNVIDNTVDTINQEDYDFPALFTGESLIGNLAQPVAGTLDINSPYLERRKKAENYLDITNQQAMAALKKSTRPLAKEYEEISNILLKSGVTTTVRNAANKAQEIIELLNKQLELETKSATYDSTGQALGQSKEAIDELNNVIQRYKNILTGLNTQPRKSLSEIFNPTLNQNGEGAR